MAQFYDNNQPQSYDSGLPAYQPPAGDPFGEPPKKRPSVWLIVVVVALLLMCCCCAFVFVLYFWLGDILLDMFDIQVLLLAPLLA
ncbi:MAG: hypothetical protein ACKOC5_16365 [Chloroflexota bacterium]